MLRISWLFCIFRYSPANKVWNPKRGKFPNKDMAKIQNISEIHRKHSKKCTFYTLRFGCSFAAVNTIKPQLL